MAETRIDELRRRLERDPGSRLFAQLAEEYRRTAEHAEAIRVARAGLDVHPAYASARLTLGRALLESGQAGAAAVELARVVREAPDNILASRFLGQALEASGDLEGAVRQYTATLKMAPGDRQLESQIEALRARAARAAMPPTGRGVPPPPPTKPMGGAPTGPRPPAPPSPAVASASRPGAGTPTGVNAESGDAADRTLMFVPEPTLNVRAEETTRQAPVPATAPRTGSPSEAPAAIAQASAAASPVADVPADSPLVDITLPRTPPELPTTAAPPIEETTLPQTPAPAFGQPSRGAAPAFADEEPLAEAVAAAPSPPGSPPPAAPAGAEAHPTVAGVPVAAEAGWSTNTRSYPAVRPEALAAHGGPPAAAPSGPAPAGDPPLSSSTLAELYLRQGLRDRAREVYQQVLADDPGNERARAGLRELEAFAAPDGSADSRAARRMALERTIAALEALLGALRRD